MRASMVVARNIHHGSHGLHTISAEDERAELRMSIGQRTVSALWAYLPSLGPQF